MEWKSLRFDWNQARAFLATAEEGSLSGAARALNLTQPTLGRQVTALEEELGVVLFDRVGRSLILTDAGVTLLDHVRQMGDAATQISLTASGRSQAIAGEVAISATHVMAACHLPSVLLRLREVAPEISIEIVAANQLSDLRRREADIAIRHARPEQPELIGKLIRENPAHLYASKAYIERHGRPQTMDDLGDGVFIGFEASDRYLLALQQRGLPITVKNFKYRAADSAVAWELVKHGLAVSAMDTMTAALTPEVEMILPDLFEPFPVPLWLVTHRELHTSRRIRLVFDLLAEELAKAG